MRVYAATKNAGKLRELREILGRFGWNVVAYDAYAEPDEGETSYSDNAALKARALYAQLRQAGLGDAAVIADDSGLEVAALDGRPGVLSARYGGPGASWSERRRALLAEVVATGSGDRSARFVCVVHFIGADGSEVSAEGAVTGTIADAERGEGGFSYDAIFAYPPLGRTFGELTEEEKNAISHRAQAAGALVEQVAARTDAGM